MGLLRQGYLIFLGVGLEFLFIDFGYFRILQSYRAAGIGILQFDGTTLFLFDFVGVIGLISSWIFDHIVPSEAGGDANYNKIASTVDNSLLFIFLSFTVWLMVVHPDRGAMTNSRQPLAV